MLNFLVKISNWKFIIPAILIYLIFAAYLFPKYQQEMNTIAREELQILDLQKEYTLAEANNLFTKLKPEGRVIYQYIASVVDMIYPFSYGILMILVIAFLLKRLFSNTSKWTYLAFMPIVIMIFDFLENTNTLALLAAYPDMTNEMVEKGSMYTGWKWFFVFITLGLVVLSAIGLMVKMFLNRKSHSSTK